MWKCRHCSQEFNYTRLTEKGNHSKHCECNPNRQVSYDKIKEANNKRFGNFVKFTVECFSCTLKFEIEEREKLFPSKSQYFCSRSCANSVGGKAKAEKYHSDDVATYRTIAWRYHDKKCIVCEETNIVAVHHLNENHKDNRPQNLIPLCPTHHQYWHSRYKYLIEDKVLQYVKDKWG